MFKLTGNSNTSSKHFIIITSFGGDWSSPGEIFELEIWKNPCFVTNWGFLCACCFSSAYSNWYFNIPSAAENQAAPADLFSCSYHNKLLIIHKYHQIVLTCQRDHLNQSQFLSSHLSFSPLSHLPSLSSFLSYNPHTHLSPFLTLLTSLLRMHK